MKILETKISVPPTPSNLVPRNRLITKLDQSLLHKLTLITAPAGSGKTTLLSEWIATRGNRFRVAWVSLDERENDPVRFWNYVASSLGTVTNIDFSGWLLELQGSPQIDLDGLIDNITKEVTNDFSLILDDYHYIHSESIHEALTYLLNYLPVKMHLVIASRTQPPLSIEQKRVHAQLLELTQHDLQFTEEEADIFFKQTTDRDLTIEVVSQLTHKTEGWIAGLQLAALALQIHEKEDLNRFVRSFSGMHQFVDGFLREQVINHQPDEIREFLLYTSILERFNSSLCNALTGRSNGQVTLRWLEKNNLFLVRLDEKQYWYRYHSLFTDFLRNFLLTSYPDRRSELYRHAAEWCEENNLLEEAVQYALEAKDYKLTAKLISQTARVVWNRGEVFKMMSWLMELPDVVLASRPLLFFTFAWLYGLRAMFKEMKGMIDRAEEYFQKPNKSLYSNYSDVELDWEDEWTLSPAGIKTLLDLAKSFLEHFSGNTATAIEIGQHAIEQIPPQFIHPRGIGFLFLGRAYLSTYDLETAERVLTDAMETNKTSTHYAAYLNSSNQLATLNIVRGSLNSAFEIYQQASQFISSLDEPVSVGIDDVGIGNIYREWNNLDEAESHISRGLKLAEAGGDFMFLNEAYIVRSRLELAKGNFDQAFEYIQSAERTFRNSPTCIENSLVQAWAVRIWLAQGEIAKAAYWNLHPKFEISSLPAFQREFWLITRARVLLAEKRLEEAKTLLEELLVSAQAGRRGGVSIEILILLALLHYERQSTNQAVDFLLRALELAKPEKYIRIFADEGTNIETLLKGIQKKSAQTGDMGMPSYLDQLLQSFTKINKGKIEQNADKIRSNQPLIEPLSERELQVLNLMSGGKSYEHVAQDLVIALSTVRWHVKNIFRKLNAHSGIEAVAIARELKILP